MKAFSITTIAALVCTFALMLIAVHAAPLDTDEQAENGLDEQTIDPDDLRNLLLQLNDDRLMRATRSWPAEARGWGLRNIDGRIARQWRADKRQVRFRQCYFNPISCFRK